MAKKKAFYEQDYLGHLGSSLLIIFSFIALVLMVAGTPTGVLMNRAHYKQCYTLWGLRPNCWKAAYGWRTAEDTCHTRRTRFEAGQAFSIMSIFAIVAVGGLGFASLLGYKVKLVTVVVAIFSIAFTIVPWALVASIYTTSYCGSDAFTKKYFKLGAGFSLMIASTGVQMIGLLVYALLEPFRRKSTVVDGESRSSNAPDIQE